MVDRRKPLAFDTTMRNPARMANFLSILRNFESRELTSDLIFDIEAEFIRQKVYEPTKAVLGTYLAEYQLTKGKNPKFFYAKDTSPDAAQKVLNGYMRWKDGEPGEVSREDVRYLLENTLTKHGEAGYEYGWEARFKTHIAFMNELGFSRIEKGKPILISDNGRLLALKYVNGYPVDDFDYAPENSAYLTAFARYQTNNPWRHNTIEVNFLSLFLNTVQYLDKKYDSKGISRKELPFFIVWPNNDYQALAEYIHEWREKFGYKFSDETIYQYAMNTLDEDTDNSLRPATKAFIESKQRDYKPDKLTRESPDDVMRKLRQTQIVSLRGNGRFLDVNTFEAEKIQQVISAYSDNNEDVVDDQEKYFDYMGSLDPFLSFESETISEEQAHAVLDVKRRVLHEWADTHDWDTLKAEIIIAANKGYSNDELLSQIEKPTRMEFLAAVIMQKALDSADVIPHYKVDDEGIPFDHASGGRGDDIGVDIDVYHGKTHALLEPTISPARGFQVEHEIPSIMNHIIRSSEANEAANNGYGVPFAIFLAGKVVSPDVGVSVAALRTTSGAEIYPWNADDFADYSQNVKSLEDYAVLRDYAKGVMLSRDSR